MSYIIGLIGALIGVIGWFSTGSIWFLVVGLIAYIIETIMEWSNLNAGAKMMDVIIFAAGCIVGLFIKSVPFYAMGMLFICFYSLLMGLITLPSVIATTRNRP